jgi:hypothetical protein
MAKAKYNLLKIKNEKELDKVLNDKICVPVYHAIDPSDNGTIAEGIVHIDEESMREEFENKLADIVQAVANY